MHDHDSSLLKLQIRGTWMYRMTMVVLIFEIEPVPKIFESHHWIGGQMTVRVELSTMSDCIVCYTPW